MNNNYTFAEKLFPFLDDSSYKLADDYPNKEGQRKIAEDIFLYLQRKYFIN